MKFRLFPCRHATSFVPSQFSRYALLVPGPETRLSAMFMRPRVMFGAAESLIHMASRHGNAAKNG